MARNAFGSPSWRPSFSVTSCKPLRISLHEGIVGVLRAPDGDRFIVVNGHVPENLIYDHHFLGMDRSPDFILIQVTSTVGNTKELKFAFYRQEAGSQRCHDVERGV